MLTVYFDTSFFIDLGAAEDDDAQIVIDELNHLEVRCVLSPYVFTELARAAGRAANHAKALDRLAAISIPPLDLSPDHDWSDLRPGSEREALADLMRSVDASDTFIRAVCAAANESAHYQAFLSCLLGEDAAEIISMILAKDPDLPVRVVNATTRRQNPDLLRRFGEVQPAGDLWVNNNRILRHQALHMHAAFVDAELDPPPVPNFESLDPQVAGARFTEWITAILGKELMDRPTDSDFVGDEPLTPDVRANLKLEHVLRAAGVMRPPTLPSRRASHAFAAQGCSGSLSGCSGGAGSQRVRTEQTATPINVGVVDRAPSPTPGGFCGISPLEHGRGKLAIWLKELWDERRGNVA